MPAPLFPPTHSLTRSAPGGNSVGAASRPGPAPQPPPDAVLASMLRSLNQQASPVTAAFFSAANLDAVQNLLRGHVRRKTNFLIDRQNDNDVLTVMRATYIDYARRVGDVGAEVSRLNDLSVSQMLPGVLSGMASHLIYLRDLDKPLEPLPYGQFTSVKGTDVVGMRVPGA